MITPNEHLHNSEVLFFSNILIILSILKIKFCSKTVRWIISQIHTLWDICKKDMKPSLNAGSPSQAQEVDFLSNKAVSAGRLWRPWEHIYAINKVTKGPFIPVYNPHGKYAVRIYFMV